MCASLLPQMPEGSWSHGSGVYVLWAGYETCAFFSAIGVLVYNFEKCFIDKPPYNLRVFIPLGVVNQ